MLFGRHLLPSTHNSRRRWPYWIATATWLLLLLATPHVTRAALPQTLSRLPENTVACLCIPNPSDFLQRLSDTPTMRMLQDPELQPLMDHLREATGQARENMEQSLGMSLQEAASLPEGEVCLAMVAPKRRPPCVVVLLEVGNQADEWRRVIELLQANLEDRGNIRSTETVDGIEITLFERTEDQKTRQIAFIYHDEIWCATTSLEVAQSLIPLWQNRDDTPTFADSTDLTTILERCQYSGPEQPQLMYFVNPVGLVQSIAAENMAFQIGLAMLRNIGLDGLRGLGGTYLLNGKQFASLHHLHVLLDSPRSGVLDVISPRSGDVTPEVWAPHDITTYTTIHWDMARSYAALVAAYDRVRGPGSWDKSIRSAFEKQFGIDLQRDVIAALDGRISRVSWSFDPQQIQQAATMVGIKLKDATSFRSTLQKAIRQVVGAKIDRRSERSVSYYCYSPLAPQAGTNIPGLSGVERFVAIVGDYLLVSDNELLLQRAIQTKLADIPPLNEELDFKLNANKISRLPGGDQPSMISFTRPEVRLRSAYVLLTSEETLKQLQQLGSSNKLIAIIYDALRTHELPPFHVLAKYFAFSGELMTSDASGIHIASFTFHRNTSPDPQEP